MNRILYFPISILLTFLVFTEILFFISPRMWNINNEISLVSYLLLMNISLYWGYRAGIKCSIKTTIWRPSQKVINGIIVLAFLFKIFLFLANNNFSIFTVVHNFFNAFHDIGQAYNGRDLKLNVTLYLTGQFLSPLIFMAYVLGICNWKQLHKKYRIFYVTIIFIELINWFSVGVRKGILDIFLIIFVSYLISNYNIIRDKARLRKLKLYFILFVIVFLSFFLVSNLARMYQYDSFTEMLDNTEAPIRPFYLKYLPKILIMPLSSISSYLCQGYYALACALEEGVIFPNLLATNIFTVNVAERFDYDPLANSYLDILNTKYGISPIINWHSIYVWLANGFTFMGVPLFIYFIGFMLANSWKNSILKKDYIAMPLFVVLFQTVFYFFANNQVFSFSFFVVTFFLGTYIFNFGNYRVYKNISNFS